ncbi:hypothetical protein [Anaerotignum sp.]
MKKKLLTLLAMTVIGAALVTGCGGNDLETVPPEESVAATITVDDASLPPMDEEIQQLYADAYKIYNQINFCNFDFDAEDVYEKDGFEYTRVADSRFKTYDEFRTFLLQYFTEQFVDNGILSPDNIMFTKGENGGLYCLQAGRGTNIFYAGHTFAMDKEGEDEMGFKATAYYANNGAPYEGDLFYEAPADPENYTTQEYLFVLWKEEAGWRFNTFHLFA